MESRSVMTILTESYEAWQFVILECYNAQISTCVVSSIVQLTIEQFHQ